MKAENLVVKFIFLLILASLTACTENPLEVKQEAPTENIEDGSVLQKKPSGSTTVFFTGSNEEYLIWVYLEINRFYEKDRALMISGSMGYQIDHKKEDTKALVSDLPFENIPLKIQ